MKTGKIMEALKSLKKITGRSYLFLMRTRLWFSFCNMYLQDMNRYLKYSRTFGNNTRGKMTGSIILQYHVLEKGLTMPETRPGFGSDRVINLCNDCIKYIGKYGQEGEQLDHAIGVILEYEDYHKRNGFVPDSELAGMVSSLKSILAREVDRTEQTGMSGEEYFRYIKSPFPEFSQSRSSIRNFSGKELPLSGILQALELARNTPSACNRQAWRTYVFSEKELMGKILEAQGGNRGFGHLAGKLIVVASELGGFCYTNERNQAYIDGGIYAMNLLYALHSLGIGACILNCSFDHRKEEKIKKLAGIKRSEVLIAMIACGNVPDQFRIALSPRESIDKTNTIAG